MHSVDVIWKMFALFLSHSRLRVVHCVLFLNFPLWHFIENTQSHTIWSITMRRFWFRWDTRNVFTLVQWKSIYLDAENANSEKLFDVKLKLFSVYCVCVCDDVFISVNFFWIRRALICAAINIYYGLLLFVCLIKCIPWMNAVNAGKLMMKMYWNIWIKSGFFFVWFHNNRRDFDRNVYRKNLARPLREIK